MRRYLVGGMVLCAVLMSGCVSKKYVDQHLNETMTAEIGDIRTEIEELRRSVESQGADIETNAAEIEALRASTRDHQAKMERLVQEALDRAEAASKVANGEFMYEVTVSDESVGFAFDRSELTEPAMRSLDIFARVLKEENDPVHIEIQGHTDNIGGQAYNRKLGQARADAVRAYLHTVHNFPLNRMDTFSYGESMPLVDNDTDENRARNRRVMLVVME